MTHVTHLCIPPHAHIYGRHTGNASHASHRRSEHYDQERSIIRQRPFCVGCGYHYAVHGEHRDDCTTTTPTTTKGTAA